MAGHTQVADKRAVRAVIFAAFDETLIHDFLSKNQ
jgi:hypothetical protein